jgi:hypothetical protein
MIFHCNGEFDSLDSDTCTVSGGTRGRHSGAAGLGTRRPARWSRAGLGTRRPARWSRAGLGTGRGKCGRLSDLVHDLWCGRVVDILVYHSRS